MNLHDELGRLADTAPRPAIDHSVWDQGRALRRRDRIVTSALVLALVVILGGLASLVLGPPRAVAPADNLVPDGAIPSRIEDIPSDLTGPLEQSHAIGRGSAAFVAGNGLPVLITAADVQYHLLDLPGWDAGMIQPLALSPSGERLAFATKSYGRTTVTVWELEYDEVSYGYEVGDDIKVGRLAWSPDGTWLAYSGVLANGTARTGRLQYPDGGERPGPVARKPFTSLAVSNDGVIAAGTQSGGLVIGSPDGPDRTTGSGTPGQFSPDGSLLSMGDPLTPTVTSTTVQLSTGKTLRHPFPSGTFDDATIHPVGWLDDRLQLLLVQESFDEDAEFVITTPQVNQTSTWRRGVGAVAPQVVESLTVAVDLIPDLDGTSSQQFTHDFGEPDWPGQRDISWIIGLCVAGAWAAILGLRWVWRRRTQLL